MTGVQTCALPICISISLTKQEPIIDLEILKTKEGRRQLIEFIKPRLLQSLPKLDREWILENVNKIKNIPGVIIQGRYDVVCPMQSAWDLHKKLTKLNLEIIGDSGHSMLERGIQDKLIEYTDIFSNQ